MEDLPALDKAVRELATQTTLPFGVSQIGPDKKRISVHVPLSEVDAARAYFTAHPVLRDDGSQIQVDVEGTASESWILHPLSGAAAEPTPIAVQDMIGRQVHEAADVAVSAGWLVRAHQPRAALTADYRRNRINLMYEANGTVTGVSVG